jgi:hypothetical protein
MRLKLIVVVSLLAAIIGSGTSIGVILAAFSSLKPIRTPGLLVLSTFLLPVVTVLLAATFVYRHTARRRKVQALLTTILSILLSLLFFILASVWTARMGSPSGPIAGKTVAQTNLLLYRSQGIYHEPDVFIQVHA